MSSRKKLRLFLKGYQRYLFIYLFVCDIKESISSRLKVLGAQFINNMKNFLQMIWDSENLIYFL